MTPVQVTITLRLTLTTSLSVGAAGSRGGLADKSIQRDNNNCPIVPGSHVKGRVRHSCERLARALGYSICGAPVARDMCPDGLPEGFDRVTTEPLAVQRSKGTPYEEAQQCVVCALFGSPTYPGLLRFGDLRQEAWNSESDQLRTGVGLDRYRRTAMDAILYTIETTAAGVAFTGQISGQWVNTPESELRPLLGLLIAGMEQSPRWGGGSSRGLGWAKLEPTVAINEQTVKADELVQELGKKVSKLP